MNRKQQQLAAYYILPPNDPMRDSPEWPGDLADRLYFIPGQLKFFYIIPSRNKYLSRKEEMAEVPRSTNQHTNPFPHVTVSVWGCQEKSLLDGTLEVPQGWDLTELEYVDSTDIPALPQKEVTRIATRLKAAEKYRQERDERDEIDAKKLKEATTIHTFTVLRRNWEMDGIGWVKQLESDERILVLTSHGSEYIAAMTELESKLKEYRDVVKMRRMQRL
jgi:hypothetical protein